MTHCLTSVVHVRALTGHTYDIPIAPYHTVKDIVHKYANLAGCPSESIILLKMEPQNHASVPLLQSGNLLSHYGMRHDDILVAILAMPLDFWLHNFKRHLPLPTKQISSPQEHVRMKRDLSLPFHLPIPLHFWQGQVGQFLEGQICGPKGSPYENGLFRFLLMVPPNYPFEGPILRFVTKIFHPLVNEFGVWVHNRKDWSAAMTIELFLLTVVAQMDSSSIGMSMNADVRQTQFPDFWNPEWCTLSAMESRAKAQQWTRCYAQPLLWRPMKKTHLHFDAPFHRLVQCIYILQKRNDGNPFARLSKDLIHVILRRSSPRILPHLWEYNETEYSRLQKRNVE